MPDKYTLAEERGGAVARAGSFWTSNISDEGRTGVQRMTGFPYLDRAPHMLHSLAGAACGSCFRTDHWAVERFDDSQVTGPVDGVWTLRFIGDRLATVIRTGDGTVLYRNRDFLSSFGKLRMKRDPRAVFPEYGVLCKASVLRTRNVLCYPLGLQDIKGPVNEVVEYARHSQSLLQFRKAAAQAGGFAVIRKDCRVETVVRDVESADVVAYIAGGDRYDTPYTHEELQVGDELAKGAIIGGELFLTVMPGEPVPDSVEGVRPGYSCPVPGLVIPNSEITLYRDGVFRPDYTPGPAKNLYWSYLDGVGAAEQGDRPATGNALEHFRTVVAPGRCIVYRLDRSLPEEMRHRVRSYMDDNCPLGAVLLEA